MSLAERSDCHVVCRPNLELIDVGPAIYKFPDTNNVLKDSGMNDDLIMGVGPILVVTHLLDITRCNRSAAAGAKRNRKHAHAPIDPHTHNHDHDHDHDHDHAGCWMRRELPNSSCWKARTAPRSWSAR